MSAQTSQRRVLDDHVVAMPADPERLRAVHRAAAMPAIAENLLRAMRLVKRARFNAHERLEAKHAASIAAFTLATVFEISLSLLTIVFEGKLAPDVKPFVDYASVVTAVFLFGFGLVVGFANYQLKAVHLQRCAMDIANLLREIEIALPVDTPTLQEFRRRYHEIEARCPYNHDNVDFEAALAGPDDKAAQRAARWQRHADVYGPYACAALAYLTLWACFWFLIKN
jgi:hypothetical protein